MAQAAEGLKEFASGANPASVLREAPERSPMSDAFVPRTRRIAPTAAAESRPLPRGFGLLIGAAVSLGLWIGIFWLLGRVFGGR
jgi:hypothetical protein